MKTSVRRPVNLRVGSRRPVPGHFEILVVITAFSALSASIHSTPCIFRVVMFSPPCWLSHLPGQWGGLRRTGNC